MFLRQLYFNMAIEVIHTVAETQCWSECMQSPIEDHQCVTASEHYTVTHNAPAHLCTHICMQRENFISIRYNHEGSYCHLTSKVCLKIVKDSAVDFLYERFRWNAFYMWHIFLSFGSRYLQQSNILVGTCHHVGDHTLVWNKMGQSGIQWVTTDISFKYCPVVQPSGSPMSRVKLFRRVL